MIARHCKVIEAITVERSEGVSYYARVTCEGIDQRIVLTADEYALATRAVRSRLPLVLAITEEDGQGAP